MVYRKALVQRHNPKLTAFEPHSPLSVGNGEMLFTADATGLQSFRELYEDAMPLCTMANHAWHSTPYSDTVEKLAKRDDLTPTMYDTYGRDVPYYTNQDDGDKYHWVRQNSHRYNLANVGFVFLDEAGNRLDHHAVTNINQELELYKGFLQSNYRVDGNNCSVSTCISGLGEVLAVNASSPLIAAGRMFIEITFSYPSHEISGSDWTVPDRHTSSLKGNSITHKMENLSDTLDVTGRNFTITQAGTHTFHILPTGNSIDIEIDFFSISNASEKKGVAFESCARNWRKYWEETGAISLEKSTDPRAKELERRIVLSQYLLKINSCGSFSPPAETGLTCNSWYGKFHLEMHFWHSAHFAMFKYPEGLASLEWYKRIFFTAMAETRHGQNYKGVRWPKMVDAQGVDSPSPIGPLLIWQQPHILFFCQQLYLANPSPTVLEEWVLQVEETANFMADFAHFDGERYVLGPPVIPVQENHKPETCLNPTFELEYWRYGLKVAIDWLEKTEYEVPEKWRHVYENLATPTIHDGVYMAHENCLDTFENFGKDHPSMLMAYGVLGSSRIDPEVMNATLDRVLKDWDYNSMWGWDFGVMAMTATRLGRPELALEILLRESDKNVYEKNGHNRQMTRKDLPCYLPGNGSLLLAVAMMAAGYEGCTEPSPGFNVEGWKVEYDGIRKYSAEC